MCYQFVFTTLYFLAIVDNGLSGAEKSQTLCSVLFGAVEWGIFCTDYTYHQCLLSFVEHFKDKVM